MRKSAIAVASLFLLGAAWAQKPDEQGSSAPAKAPSVQAHSYKGTLVDASCAANVTQKTPAGGAEGNAADRQQGQGGCAVSASTKEFALQTADGKVLRFDAVGNQRAEGAIKDRKKWNTAASSGKAISAKVSGTLDGDNLTVFSLD